MVHTLLKKDRSLNSPKATLECTWALETLHGKQGIHVVNGRILFAWVLYITRKNLERGAKIMG